MLDLSEFDYEFVLRSYSVQDLALEQSQKRKLDDGKTYEEKLKAFKQIKKDLLETDHNRQILYSKLTKKLNVKHCLSKLQQIPNERAQSIQKDILLLQQNMSRESDEFVSSVNSSVKKFQNLGTEFDEDVILNNKLEASGKILSLKEGIHEMQKQFNVLKNMDFEGQYTLSTYNLKTSGGKYLDRCSEDSKLNKMKSDIFQNDQNFKLINKNVFFLKQGNADLQSQRDNLK